MIHTTVLKYLNNPTITLGGVFHRCPRTAGLLFVYGLVFNLLACTPDMGTTTIPIDDKWSHPTGLGDNISSDSNRGRQESDDPQVAMDNNGNAIIVWAQHTLAPLSPVAPTGRHEIFKSEYRGGSWIHPADLSEYISPDSADGGHMVPQVAMNDSGQAAIAWRGDDGTNRRTYRSDYNISATDAWTHPTDSTDAVSTNTVDTEWRNAQTAMDNNGNVIVVWEQLDDTANCNAGPCVQIYMSEYRDNGTGTWVWTGPTTISLDGQVAESPQVAMDNNGNAIIVWAQHTTAPPVILTGRHEIFKSEYRDNGTGTWTWTHPEDLSEYISPNTADGGHTLPQVAMNDNGQAVIVWRGSDGNKKRIYRSDYNMSATDPDTWEYPANSADAISPLYTTPTESEWWGVQVAINDNGNAIIVWEQTDGANTQIFKSEYRNGVWIDPSNLNGNISAGGQDAALPQVAMDNNGDAIIVWEQQSDDLTATCLAGGTTCKQIFKSEYRNGSWAHPADLTGASYISPDGQDAGRPQVAMDDNGNAIIVWQQFDDTAKCQGVTPSEPCPQIFKSEYRANP